MCKHETDLINLGHGKYKCPICEAVLTDADIALKKDDSVYRQGFGGVCENCGRWLGGDYGMNGDGKQTYHECPKKRKIIFLDIDGVLNNQDTFKKVQRATDMFEPYLVLLMNRIVEATGAEVVLSSSWRHGYYDELKKHLPFPLLDKTGSADCRMRGCEIHEWLTKNVEGFSSDGYMKGYHKVAILDDDSDMLLWQKDDFFKTTFKTGLTEEIAENVIKHLNRSNIEIVASPRIDYCSQCGNEHGFDCPLDRPDEPDTNDPSQFPAEGSDMP